MVALAQWLEHQVVDLRVDGSSPLCHPNYLLWVDFMTNFCYSFVMTEQLRYNAQSFDSARDSHSQRTVVSGMVIDGDSLIYERLNPLSEDAFNYRDVIDVENHISGIETIKRYIPKEGIMLYLASSYGLASVLLEEEGYNVVSLDIDRNALRFASNYARDQINADARSLPFVDDAFSAVVSRDFLAKDYHLPSDDGQNAIVD